MPENEKTPWWRHWHVEGKPFGYSLREAKLVQKDIENVLGWTPEIERCDTDHSKRWEASIERPAPASIMCDSFGAAMRAGDGLQRIAYANGYGVKEYGHAVYPTVTIREITQ